MSEDSLLDGEVQETEASPALERPEWLVDKYITDDRSIEDSIKEQARAYKELQGKFGGFTGAPEEYQFSMPEGIEGEIDTELETYKQFLDIAKEANMSNDTAQKLFEIFVDYQNQQSRQLEVDRNAQIQALGPDAGKRIQQMIGWANNNLSPEENQVLHSMTYTAEQIGVLEKIIGMTKNSVLPKTNTTETVTTGYTMDDYARDVQDPRYYNDPYFREQARKKASGLV